MQALFERSLVVRCSFSDLKRGYIAETVVLDEYRSLGVGQTLVEEATSFLKEQGCKCTVPIMYQDNKSAILLEHNGTKSSSKWTKHQNICYYFLTDLISSNELMVKYCPTDGMVGIF